MPIPNDKGQTIAIAQLVKEQQDTFTEVDVVTFEALAIFFGLALRSVFLYEDALKLTARQQIALEVLVYHASASMEETVEFMVSRSSIVVRQSNTHLSSNTERTTKECRSVQLVQCQL